MLGWKDLINQALLAWDSVNYEWDLRVLNFDEDNQRTFLYALGLRDGQWPQILGGVAVVVAACLALLSLALRRPGRAACGRRCALVCALSAQPRGGWRPA